MTAAKISAHPKNSRAVGTWERSKIPPTTEKTDSKLMSSVAVVGLAPFCPTTWRV